jgi:hypothetical protein
MKKMDIPEYYRQFQTTQTQKPEEEKKTEKLPQEQVTQKIQPKQETQKTSQTSQTPQVKDKTIQFQGNRFMLNQLEDWEDKTLYTLLGPVTDSIQHNVIIDVERNAPFDSLEEFAEWHIKTLEDELKSCILLKRGDIKLTNGTDAYEAIFSWYPSDETRIYQQQIFVLTDKTAYKMTASYTKKTRKTLGPAIERMMLSLSFSNTSKK